MTIWRLVRKEIRHRKLNFSLGLLSIIVAVGCLVGAMTLLRAHDVRTQQILQRKEAETKAKLDGLKDSIRKAMLTLGFNVLILPKDQDLGDLYADDYATKYMPESYVDKLVNSKIMIVRHLLPSLHQKIKWPETKRTIILIGTHGEVPMMHRGYRKPLIEAVPSGTMVVGYELHQSLGLKVGDKPKLMGREFTVSKVHQERGSKDDITVWINLKEAQELLDKKGLINVILALECRCDRPDLAKLRSQISVILPETQVIEKMSEALARAEARDKTAEDAKALLAREKEHRDRLREEREALASVLVPLVIGACAVWIGFLTFGNVRDRRGEIGILRALGTRSRHIFSLFLAKAFLIGLLGAVLGFLAGVFVGASWGAAIEEMTLDADISMKLFEPRLLIAVLIAAPLLACAASWIPAMLATQEDPAVILREE